jgi:hypothetical protein
MTKGGKCTLHRMMLVSDYSKTGNNKKAPEKSPGLFQ